MDSRVIPLLLQKRNVCVAKGTANLLGAVAHWCSNYVPLQPEDSGGQGLITGRSSPFERRNKRWWTPLRLLSLSSVLRTWALQQNKSMCS